MDNTVKKVRDIFTYLEKERNPWVPQWEAVAELVSPLREDIYGISPHKQRGTKIYDGTVISALNMFADGLYGYIMSPAQPWFRLYIPNVTNSPGTQDARNVEVWLEDVESLLYDALSRSNFYDVAWQFLHDGGAIGTAIMYIEEDLAGSRIAFEVVPIGESYIADSAYGYVDTLIRKRKLPLRNILAIVGDKNLPVAFAEQSKASPYSTVEIIHAVYPRENRNTSKLNARNKKYLSAWVYNQDLLRESGYDEFPYIVWRYAKTGRSAYGISPAMMALSEIKGLNLISKTMLAAAQLSVEPPLNIPSELEGRVELRPRGLNYYEDPKKIIRPISTGINYPIGVDREERKQRAIEKYFYTDFFTLIANSNGQMTATEIVERQGEKAAVLAAAVGKLNSDAMNRIIDRVFDIEYKAGRLPPPPESLLNTNSRIDVEYIGPLSQIQRRYFQSVGTRAGIEAISPMLSIRPDTADVVDWDEAARSMLDSYSFPQKALLSRDEVSQIRQARIDEQRAAAAKQEMGGLVQSLKVASEADRNMNGALLSAPLNDAMEGSQGMA